MSDSAQASPPTASRFDQAIAGLSRQLRLRKALRAASWGFFFGAIAAAGLFLWLWFETPRYLALSTWLGLDAESNALDLILLLAPPLVFGIAFGLRGWLKRLSPYATAQWADHVCQSGNAVAAALDAKGSTFQESLEARALEPLSTSRLQALATLRFGYHTLALALLLLAMWVAFAFKPIVKAPDFFEPKSLVSRVLEPLAPIVGEQLDNPQLAEALKTLGEQGLAESLGKIEELKKELEAGGLSQADALAKLNQIEELMNSGALNEQGADLLQQMLDNPEALSGAQKAIQEALKEGANGEGNPNPDPAGEAAKMLGPMAEKLGLGGPELMETLQKALQGNDALGRLLMGKEGASEDAEAILGAREEAGDQVEVLRQRVLNPDVEVVHKPAGAGLLKRLQERSSRRKENGEAVRENARTVPLTERAGIDTIKREDDFISRPNKLPPHLERAAKRYFGND